MLRYNNVVCITGPELIITTDNPDGIITKSCYDQLVNRRHIKVIRRACRGNEALIEYESLPDRYKSMVRQRYGDPYENARVTNFISHMVRDSKAFEFYSNYVLDNGDSLPAKNIDEYCTNAEILNTIHLLVTDTKAFRKGLGGRSTGIADAVLSIVNDLPESIRHTLPSNIARLKEKYKTYLRDGYISLIHKGFCNKNTEKINDQAKLWLLAMWANPVHRVTSETHLLNLYNQEATQKGWKKIDSVNTIHNFLFSDEIKDMWWGHRYGELKAKEKFMYQHTTRMPTLRDSLWYSDGTKLNFYYLDSDGAVSTISVYEVMDAYSEVFLGYHVSKNEDYEAQFKAYKMAIQTSGYRPFEIRFDNQGGHKKLDSAEFFSKISRLSIKTQPYNGKSKTIESAFGRFQAQHLAQYWYFTGQNITAKKDSSRANMEFIQANKANLPCLNDIMATYAAARNAWNNAPHPVTGIPRMEMYRNSHNPSTVKVELWDMVDIFWIFRKDPVTVTAYGISFTDKKLKKDYMVQTEDGKPDIAWLRKNVDRKLHVKVDPDDDSIIYLYEKDASGYRFVTAAFPKVVIHRNIQEQEDWEREYIHSVTKEVKRIREQRSEEMDLILEMHNSLPEQHGLNSAGLKGISKKQKGQKDTTGKQQKHLSNLVESIEDQDSSSIYSLM